MGILDELAEKFAITLDSKLCCDSNYLKAIALLHEFAEGLSPEQSAELDDIAGRLTSASFNAVVRSGLKLVAKTQQGERFLLAVFISIINNLVPLECYQFQNKL